MPKKTSAVSPTKKHKEPKTIDQSVEKALKNLNRAYESFSKAITDAQDNAVPTAYFAKALRQSNEHKTALAEINEKGTSLDVYSLTSLRERTNTISVQHRQFTDGLSGYSAPNKTVAIVTASQSPITPTQASPNSIASLSPIMANSSTMTPVNNRPKMY